MYFPLLIPPEKTFRSRRRLSPRISRAVTTPTTSLSIKHLGRRPFESFLKSAH